jgi:hypothetical protein
MTAQTGGGGVRVALVHGFAVDVRGAERVVLALGDMCSRRPGGPAWRA